jgi:XTP/dITP diphosphohydrolase
LKWIIASRNRDKFQEIRSILSPLGVEFISLNELSQDIQIKEEGFTFIENAMAKAEEVFRKFGFPTIADDSGLVVDALDGMPGIFSSRFAGENASYGENRKKLLKLLEGIPYHRRRAKFVCVAVFMDESGKIIEVGEVEGFITQCERGEGGFGYDPIFLYPSLGRTFSEIPVELKNKISHRGIAFRKILDRLKERMG